MSTVEDTTTAATTNSPSPSPTSSPSAAAAAVPGTQTTNDTLITDASTLASASASAAGAAAAAASAGGKSSNQSNSGHGNGSSGSQQKENSTKSTSSKKISTRTIYQSLTNSIAATAAANTNTNNRRWVNRVLAKIYTESLNSISVNPFVNHWQTDRLEALRVLTIGWVMAIIRVVPFVCVLVFACLLAKIFLLLIACFNRCRLNSEPVRMFGRDLCFTIIRVALFFAGFYWIRVIDKRRDRSRFAPIIPVAPHSSFFDIIIILILKKPTFVSKSENIDTPLIGNVLKLCKGIYVNRSDKDSRQQTIAEIRNRANKGEQVLIFPEGTCTNRSSLLQFKLGAFIPKLPVQPIVVRWDAGSRDTVTWSWEGPSVARLVINCLSRISTNCEITILPEYCPNNEEKANTRLFSENVSRVMCTELGVLQSYYSFDDVPLMVVAKVIRLFRSPVVIVLLKMCARIVQKRKEFLKQQQQQQQQQLSSNTRVSKVSKIETSGGGGGGGGSSIGVVAQQQPSPDQPPSPSQTPSQPDKDVMASSSLLSHLPSNNQTTNVVDGTTTSQQQPSLSSSSSSTPPKPPTSSITPTSSLDSLHHPNTQQRLGQLLTVGEDFEHTPLTAEVYVPKNFRPTIDDHFTENTGNRAIVPVAQFIIAATQQGDSGGDVDGTALDTQKDAQHLPISGARRPLYHTATYVPPADLSPDRYALHQTYVQFIEHCLEMVEKNFEFRPIESSDDLMKLLALDQFVQSDEILHSLRYSSIMIDLLKMIEFTVPTPVTTAHLLIVLHLADVRECDMWKRIRVVIRLFDAIRQCMMVAAATTKTSTSTGKTTTARRPPPPPSPKSSPGDDTNNKDDDQQQQQQQQKPKLILEEYRTLLWYALGLQDFNDQFFLEREYDFEYLREHLTRIFHRATWENAIQLL